MDLESRFGQIGLLKGLFLFSVVLSLILYPSVLADNFSNFTNHTGDEGTINVTLNITNISLHSNLNLSVNVSLNGSNDSNLSIFSSPVPRDGSNLTNDSLNLSKDPLGIASSEVPEEDEKEALPLDNVGSDDLLLVEDELLGTTDYYVAIDDPAMSDEESPDEISGSSSGSADPDSNQGMDLPMGDVVAVEDEFGLSDLYVALDDDVDIDDSYRVEISDLLQGEVVIGEPVSWYQEFKVINDDNDTKNLTINLANYDDLPDDFLSDVTSFAVYSHIDQISETPVFNVQIGPLEEVVLTIIYQTAPVFTEVTCEDVTISDLLPKDAVILSSDLDVSSVVASRCNLRVYHNSKIHYENIRLNLEAIEGISIDSIYYVEGDQFLRVEDGVVLVPETV